MLSTKVQSFIENSNIDDLIKWLNDNPTMVNHSATSLMSRLGKDETLNSTNIINLFSSLYIKKETVSEVEFNILEEVVRNITSRYLLSNDLYTSFSNDIYVDNNSNQLCLILLLMTSYDITNNDFTMFSVLSKHLYQMIMDAYIPFDDPDLLIDTMIEHYPIEEIVQNCNNTNWFTKVYNEKELYCKVSMKELLLLFKYISDIYSNREMKVELFLTYHKILKTTSSYKEHFQNLVDRYSKYFGDDTAYLIVETLHLLEKDVISDDESSVFVAEWSTKYSDTVTPQLMQYFIRDIQCLSVFISKYSSANAKRNTANMNNVILKMWGSEICPDESLQINTNSVNNSIDIDILSESVDFDYATEAVHKDSPVMNSAEKKIYKAYRTYKSAEEKVDSQITKALNGIKGVLTGDVRSEIIEGKKFSAIGLLKKLLGTCALFSFGKIKAIITIVVGYALKKKTSVSERRKIIMELETELKLIDEKIEDARGDGNREAKYAMMRTKAELENALKKIQYGLEADTRSLANAKNTLNAIRGK